MIGKPVMIQGFNSIVVRLKALRLKRTRPGDFCFNSIVVRLKDGGLYPCLSANEFQFHSGSIKRLLAILGQLHTRAVSIP